MSSIIKINKFTYKISDHMMMAIKTRDIQFIMRCFEDSGYNIRIVGGAVRDLVGGRQPKDIDFSTDATPTEIKKICDKNSINCFETGLKHGTLTAVINKINYEITTLRNDVETDGRHAVVEFIKDFELDAGRRDLTINAMSLTLSGYLYDYFNGLEDLINCRIRFVNDPRTRINEDYLRILRYFRFYSKLSLNEPKENSFENVVLKIIKELAPSLRRIATERIWSELSKILVSPHAPYLVKLMHDLDVLENSGFYSLSHSDIDMFSIAHCRATNRKFDENICISPCSLVASLYSHDDSALALCKRLKMSRLEIETCLFIIKYRNGIDFNVSICEHIIRHYKSILAINFSGYRLDNIRYFVSQLMLYEGCSNEHVEHIQSWSVPPFPVKGNDINKIVTGPKIAQALRTLKIYWIESDYLASREQLIQAYLKNSL